MLRYSYYSVENLIYHLFVHRFMSGTKNITIINYIFPIENTSILLKKLYFPN